MSVTAQVAHEGCENDLDDEPGRCLLDPLLMTCLPNRVIRTEQTNQCYNPIGLDQALQRRPTDPFTRRPFSLVEQALVREEANKLRSELGMPAVPNAIGLQEALQQEALSVAMQQQNEQRAREAIAAGARYDWYRLDPSTFNWAFRLRSPLQRLPEKSRLLLHATVLLGNRLEGRSEPQRLEQVHNFLDIMDQLIEAGADVNTYTSAGGYNCLAAAAWADRTYAHAANFPAPGSSGSAMIEGVNILLAAGARVNDHNDSALGKAVEAGSIRMVTRLLDAGATPLTYERTRGALLHHGLWGSTMVAPWFDPEAAPYVTAHIAQIMASAREQRRAHP
jgi:hypothetical protein